MDRAQDYESTLIILSRAQSGNLEAREELYRRLIPRLERFAHGRVQSSLRSITDTQEIVQDTIVRSLAKISRFRPNHEGALLQYLKQALINRIRDLSRRGRRVAAFDGAPERASGNESSPVEQVVGWETLSRFEAALERLSEDQRAAVSLHVEMGYTLDELAGALGRSSEAARKVLFRGLRNVAEFMKVARE
jgi:RNA polymerase sigma-70 factor (ECF subfamily)